MWSSESRFPSDRGAHVDPDSPLRKAESEWQKQLAQLDEQHDSDDRSSVYRLRAFQQKEKHFGYLVGSYEEVAAYMKAYLLMGVRDFILDSPYDEDEVGHSSEAMRLAVASMADDGGSDSR